MSLFVLLLFLLTICSLSEINIYDPRVYNYYFYVTTNSDIISSNITTEKEAANHWKTIGILQGKQACGSFHVKQFLDNYPSLKQKYGTNYTGAIDYYLQKNGGYDQKLYGYTIGGGYGRYTLGNINKSLYISGSLRMAGAIDSLVWNNTEFINNWGHGRQLQCTVGNHSGPCWNPTEAGTHDDWQSNYTHSILINITTININEYQNYVLPAFWLLPGESDTKCTKAYNTNNVSNFTMHKSIKILNNNNYDKFNIFEYNMSFYIPYSMPFIQFEAPTAYLPKPFTMFYGLNMSNYELINYFPVRDNQSNIPVIIATNDSNYALGVIPKIQPAFYGLYNFSHLTPDSNSCSKWNVVQEFYNISAKNWLHFTNYLCVGSLNNVKNCMIQMHSFSHSKP